MATRRRTHNISLQNRANVRQDKCGKSTNYYTPQTTVLPPPTSKDLQDQAAYDTRYVTDSRTYAAESPTDDNEYKVSDERDSNDSMSAGDTSVNPDGNLDADPREYRDMAADMKREKLMQDVMYNTYPSAKRMPMYHADNYDDIMRSSNHHTQQRRAQDYIEKKTIYDTTNDPLTMQKMRKLRELQRRREIAEKFYSHEIRRLIGDQYDMGGKNPMMMPGRQMHHHEKTYAGDRTASNFYDSLEKCGTMTTITRLDCGCAEQVIRPIFTTPSGHTSRKTCAQDQQVRMRMSAPNARFVHSQTAPPGPRLKSKSFGEQRSAGHEQQQQQQQRVNSPGRIKSESSVASV